MQRARRGACVCAAAWTSLQRAVLPRALATDAGGKYAPSPEAFMPPARDSYDVLVLGGGHNGLIAAAYLSRAGLSVAVLERRGLLGGAAVTEELVPGFRFSRASYLAGLLRPQIISDLGLHDHGFRYLVRDPSSFTPTPEGGLLLGSDDAKNAASIARFSKADAEAFPRYEAFLSDVRAIVSPLLDGPPPEAGGGAREKLSALWRVRAATRAASASPETLAPLTELLTAPAAHILDRWFESDVLKATLATDAVIGALVSPRTPGSAYVLLHHVMGEAAGRPGVWAYVQGGACLLPSVISLLAAPACLLPALTLPLTPCAGMGALSCAVAASARAAGATLLTNADVSELLLSDGATPAVEGVRLRGGLTLRAKTVLAACTPFHLFTELMPAGSLPPAFAKHVAHADYSCGAFKVNLALSRLPQYSCLPDTGGAVGPQHVGTAHFETHMDQVRARVMDIAARLRVLTQAR